MNQAESCRVCMELKANLQQLNDEFREIFYSVTQTKLIKLENYSSSICFSCCQNLRNALDYRNNLIKIQQQIFESCKMNSEYFNDDPINPSTIVDSSTVLLIKQEPEIQIPQNPYNEEVDESLDEQSEIEIKFKKIKQKKNLKVKLTRNEKRALEIIPCDYCFKPIKKYYFKKHLEKVHSGGVYLFCDICNHQSHLKTALEVHMTKHFKIKPFECINCDMKYRTKKDLRLHTGSAHPNDISNTTERFICEQCGKSFRFKKSLEIHARSNHTLERPFKCDESGCNAAYFCNTNLMTHKKRAHTFETVTCEICGKTFNTLINLNEHVRKNHKEGRHVCPAEGCGRRFITPYYMNLHAKTHYGIRDRECLWCGQRFFNKKHLNQHVEVAHKKSRFYCQVPGCTSVFSRKCNIREHVKKIHRELSEDAKQQLLSDITKMKPIYMVEEGKEEKWTSGNQKINELQNVDL